MYTIDIACFFFGTDGQSTVDLLPSASNTSKTLKMPLGLLRYLRSAKKRELATSVTETLQEAAKNQELITRNQRPGSAIVVGVALEQGKSIAETERTDAKIQRRLSSAKRAGAGPELPTDAFDFEVQRAGRKQPYYMRGDARFDTPAGLKKRLQLLESGKVARAARQFWDALQLQGEDAAMSYDDYCKVHANPSPNPNPKSNPNPKP